MKKILLLIVLLIPIMSNAQRANSSGITVVVDPVNPPLTTDKIWLGVGDVATETTYPVDNTGEVTGITVLTVDPTAISNKALKSSLAGTEEVLINDAGTLKKTTSQDIADLGGGGGTFSSASAYNTASHSITTTPTDIPFGGEDWDTDSYHSTSTNTERLTAPSTGYYLVTFQGRANVGSTPPTNFTIDLNKNGAADRQFIYWGTFQTNSKVPVQFSIIRYLTVGDYMTINTSATGTGVNFLSHVNVGIIFQIQKLD